MTEIFSFIQEYIYLEYTVAVIGITWLVRSAVPKVDTLFNPKLTAAFVGVILGIAGVIYKAILLDADHIMKFIVSFAMSAFAYDYTIYFLKKKLSPPAPSEKTDYGDQGEPGTRPTDKTTPS